MGHRSSTQSCAYLDLGVTPFDGVTAKAKGSAVIHYRLE